MCMKCGSKRLIMRVMRYEGVYKLENCVSGWVKCDDTYLTKDECQTIINDLCTN